MYKLILTGPTKSGQRSGNAARRDLREGRPSMGGSVVIIQERKYNDCNLWNQRNPEPN